MARIRTIKPEFFTSLTIADLSLHARLTFIGLWTHVDDAGRCVDDARLIKAAVWPLDDRLSTDVERDLHELSESSLIVRYEVDGRSYIAVRTWDEHQRINRATPSKLPPPPATPPGRPPRGGKPTSATPGPGQTPTPPAPEPESSEDSRTAHAQLSEGSLPERKGKERKGKEGNYPALASLDAVVLDAQPVTDGSPVLFAVPDPPAEPAPANAGTITREWIDYCAANGVKLTTRAIKRYAAAIKDALGQQFDPNLIKRALGQMLADREAARPSLFDNYLIRAQTGPAKPPPKMARSDQAIAEHLPPGASVAAYLHDVLTRPA